MRTSIIALIVMVSLIGCGISPETGVNVTAVGLAASSPAPQLGVVFDPNDVIVHVEPQNSAGLSDIRVGDVLILVEDIDPSQEAPRIRQLLAEKEAGETLNVQIKRNGEEVTVVVTLVPYIPSTIQQPLGEPTDISNQPFPTGTPVREPLNYL